jgi:DNA-binding MarR family transcriptional regulator
MNDESTPKGASESATTGLSIPQRQPVSTSDATKNLDWIPSPLVVDGSRVCVRWVAGLPGDWTTDGERLVLLVMACDAFERESRPGLSNLSAWTGMRRSSVARIVDRLLKPNDARPALLVKTNQSKGGRSASCYRLLTEQQPLTETAWQSPTETRAVSQQSPYCPPLETASSLPAVSLGVSVGDPPFPSPEIPSLSAEARAVANALGLQDDDEKLTSVDKMLKDNGAQKPMGWIRSCAKNGDLGQLLDDAHGATRAKQFKAAETDSRRCPHGVINGIRAKQCPPCTDAIEQAAS